MELTADPNSIQHVSNYINLDSILSNYKSFRPGSKQKLDTIFSDKEKSSLNKKLQNIARVRLDPNKLSSRYTIRDTAVVNESFPVFQKSNAGSEYAFIFQKNEMVPEYARMLIYERKDDKWEILGFGQLPLFDKEAIRDRIKEFSEEYQVINSILLGSQDLIQIEFEKVFKKNGGYTEENFKLPEDLQENLGKNGLKKIMDYLNNSGTGKIDVTQLVDGLKAFPESEIENCREDSVIRLSKPYLFELEGEKFAIIYSSKINSPFNGSGSIKLLKKRKGFYEITGTLFFWIS